MDLGELAKLAADVVGGQLSRQEGLPVKFKAIIVRTQAGDYLVRWEEGKNLEFEKLEGVREGTFGPSFGPSGEHPPTFDLRRTIGDLSFPLHVPYSTMAGPLAGRGAHFVIHADGRIEDHCMWMS
jgi:hypothetical protein